MPNYYAPGIYIEEVNKGPRPIEAVATAVAAFVGFAPAGPANTATLVTNWTQFVETFGERDQRTQRKDPYIKGAYLAHAVYGFFLNGGTRCYVVRILPPDAFSGVESGKLEVSTASARQRQVQQPLLRFIPKPPSSNEQGQVEPLPAQEIVIAIERSAGTAPAEKLWTLRVSSGEETEVFTNVTLAPGQPVAPPEQKATPASQRKGSKNTETTASPTSSAETATTGGNSSHTSDESTSQPAEASHSGGQETHSSTPQRETRSLQEVNAKSKLIQVALVEPTPNDRDPAVGVYYIDPPQPDKEVLATVQAHTIVGDPIERSGVVGLELADDVTMVCCPDLVSTLAYPDGEVDPERVKDVQLAMINHCEVVGGRMAILDVPPNKKPQEAESWRLDTAGYDSMFAALYYPWIMISNPLAGQEGEPATIIVPPCGHIAGIYARNDVERGVHKAPANEVVRGALRPVLEVTNGEQEGLNPNGVNCIRSFRGRGVRVWGARTLTSDPAWRYVNVRRLFNMVEKSIEVSTQWVVFEPNDPGLWSRVRRDVTSFLMTLWRDGMLFGNTPQEAFFVKCDEELNPPESRDLGRLIIEVGLAPVKPAEFVIFRFSQYTGGGE